MKAGPQRVVFSFIFGAATCLVSIVMIFQVGYISDLPMLGLPLFIQIYLFGLCAEANASFKELEELTWKGWFFV